MNGIVIVIPAYNPPPTLVSLISDLLSGFAGIIVVDDGSYGADDVFAELRRMSGVLVLRHEINRGKGAALKTAFKAVFERFPAAAGVVTVDADGQHLPEDVRSVAEATSRNPDALTLGTRAFSGSIPFRSWFGNMWTRWEFFLLTGVDVRDTQTGLRGIPSALIPAVSSLGGDRYEYESRMLVYGARLSKKPLLIPISTVYKEGNSTSHFKPVKDTLRTQWALVAAAFSTFARGRISR